MRRWRLQGAGIAAIATGALAVTVWWGAVSPDNDNLRVTVLDIGQGDAILIETPDGHRVLVDGGPNGSSLMEALSDTLPSGERTIDLVVLTHGVVESQRHAERKRAGFLQLLAQLLDQAVETLIACNIGD